MDNHRVKPMRRTLLATGTSCPRVCSFGHAEILRLKKSLHLTLAATDRNQNANEIRYGLSAPNLLAQPKHGDQSDHEPKATSPNVLGSGTGDFHQGVW